MLTITKLEELKYLKLQLNRKIKSLSEEILTKAQESGQIHLPKSIKDIVFIDFRYDESRVYAVYSINNQQIQLIVDLDHERINLLLPESSEIEKTTID